MDAKSYHKILVRGVNWIGDAVMTMPALRAIRQAYPGSAMSLLVNPSVAPLFVRNPNIDEVILYEDRFRKLLGKLRLVNTLRKMSFSEAILLQNAFDAALISFLARIPERIGYDRDSRGYLLTKRVPFNNDDRKVHHIEYYLNLLEAVGIKAPHAYPWIYLSIEERLWARDRLSGLRRPLLGINPGATYGSAKRWFPERFADVANWFTKDTGGSVVIFGSTKELDIVQEIGKNILENKLLLAGKTSLRELISLISESDAFLSNDSGPMHVSYAVGTPLVALFGSTDPRLTGPVGNGNVVVRSNVSCSPCFQRTCKKNDMQCMYGITSDEVFLEVKKILPTTKAVFFDRDGTLCKDSNYLSRWEDFEVFPEITSLQLLKEQGFLLIGVSNQSGIFRGIIDESFVKEVNKVFIREYGFDDFYYCPHSPYDHCPCRKPEPGMVSWARGKYKINPRRSYVVGDKNEDMLLAKAVGAKSILVTTGRDRDSINADFIVKNLTDAARVIISDATNQS